MTAKSPVTTVAEYDQAIEKEAKGLPQIGAERPVRASSRQSRDSAHRGVLVFDRWRARGLAGAACARVRRRCSREAFVRGIIAGGYGNATASFISDHAFGAGRELRSGQAISAEPSPLSPVVPLASAAPSSPVTPGPVSEPSMHTAAANISTEIPSPVKTVSGSGPGVSAPSVVVSAAAVAEAPVKTAEVPALPAKSISQRVKETWKLWFGE